MERLTFEGNFCDIAQCKEIPCPYNGECSQRKVWERLKAYEDTHMMPSDVTSMRMDMAIIAALFNGIDVDRMKELAEADKDGRLVVLPCQSGEHVFALLDDQKRVRECEVKHAVLDGWRKIFYIVPVGGLGDAYSAPFGAFGKTVFLTREEAEKALEAKK